MKDMRSKMHTIAQDVKKHLPDGFGFFVLILPLKDAEGRANYASDCQRKDVINLMKEFIIRAGHSEDWMKHVDE